MRRYRTTVLALILLTLTGCAGFQRLGTVLFTAASLQEAPIRGVAVSPCIDLATTATSLDEGVDLLDSCVLPVAELGADIADAMLLYCGPLGAGGTDGQPLVDVCRSVPLWATVEASGLPAGSGRVWLVSRLTWEPPS